MRAAQAVWQARAAITALNARPARALHKYYF
jgi:hypothetical protein